MDSNESIVTNWKPIHEKGNLSAFAKVMSLLLMEGYILRVEYVFLE